MPEISRFYGIRTKMHYAEHPPPHFHAEYGSDQMLVDIERLAVMAGPHYTTRHRHGYRMGKFASG